MKITLAVPCYDGRVHDAHMSSVYKTMKAAQQRGIEISLLTARGCPVLPDVRNWCVAMAMANGSDKVWFVDSDIAWENCIDETLNMLLAPVDIVVGVHQKRNSLWNDPANLVFEPLHLPPREDPETGLWEVKSAATAFMCIDRSVFERLADAGIAQRYIGNGPVTEGAHYKFYRNYFWYDFQPAALDEASEAFLKSQYDGPYQRLRGEDFYFCNKAKSIGCRIFADPRIGVVHFDGCVQHNVSLADVRFEAVEQEPD